MAEQRKPHTSSQDALNQARNAADEAQRAADEACGCAGAEKVERQQSDISSQAGLSGQSTSFSTEPVSTGQSSLGSQSLRGNESSLGNQSFQGNESSGSQESASAKLSRQQHEMRAQAEQIKSAARETGEEVRRKGAEMASEAKHQAREMKDRAVHSAAEVAQQAQHQAASFAQDQKSRIADELQTFGKAVSCAADKLREDHDDRIASYADLCAEQLRSTADYFQTRSVGELVGDVENLARRRPEIFFGGMLLVGLGIARFLKSSSRPRRSQYRDQYGPTDWDDQTQMMDYETESAYGASGMYSGGSYGVGSTRAARTSYNAESTRERDSTYGGRPLDSATDSQAWPESQSPSKSQPMNDPLSYH